MELLLDPAAALGAPLRGRVRLDGSAGRLRLSLLRFAVGPDARFDTATTVVTRLLLEEAAGVTEVPFELTPERGPTSWSEGLVRSQWRLGVIFTRPDGQQEQASRAVEVGPYAGPPPDAAERAARLVEERLEVARDRYQSFYDRSWTLIWGAGAAALALPPALGALSMGPALAAAAGVGGLVAALRGLAPGWLRPQLAEPSGAPVIPAGGALRVTLAGDTRGLRWQLLTTARVEQWEDTLRRGIPGTRTVVRAEHVVRSSGEVDGPLVVAIPPDGPSQLVAPHRQLVWTLRLWRPTWFGYEAEVRLPVVVAPWGEG